MAQNIYRVEEVRLNFLNRPDLAFSYCYKNANVMHDYTPDAIRDFYRQYSTWLDLFGDYEPVDITVLVNGTVQTFYRACYDRALWSKFVWQWVQSYPFDVFMAELIVERFRMEEKTAKAA